MSKVICPEDRPIVTVERGKGLPNISGAYVQGFENWCVIQNLDEFQVDGYSLVQISYIKRMRLDERDRFYAKLCDLSGASRKIRPMAPGKTQDILTYLASRKAHRILIVECERKGKWRFSIGRLRKMDEKHLYIKHFDATAKFEKALRKIDISDISRIGYDERYIKVFEKYFARKK